MIATVTGKRVDQCFRAFVRFTLNLESAYLKMDINSGHHSPSGP